MSSLRYDLDRLGWLEFERLIQGLLKERLGLGVEAWGGRSDAGRDAYYGGALCYPAKLVEPGPFVFQVKFVEAANAAGARPAEALRAAVTSEAARIAQRRNAPRHFALLTNARASVGDRTFITSRLENVLPSTAVHIHDGVDVCAWLDGTPSLLQTYPQIIGLAPLVPLLEQIVGAEIVSRSRAAIREAEGLAKVFVTTRAYHEARRLLSEHAFVVIVGPPEVGKTAIGRMLALTAVAREWEAVECVWPDDFHKAFRASKRQLFLADDFFGRSEYDTRMGSAWLRELPRALSMVDENHHLVFTTRRHLLALLKDELDLSGRARHFPDPSKLTVDAGELTRVEKGEILYRHAKVSVKEKPMRDHIRRIASSLVDDPHFTPERIRRLVEDQSAYLLEQHDTAPRHAVIFPTTHLAREALARPTDGMRITFRRLPPAHRWMLYALTENKAWQPPAEGVQLQQAYEQMCPEDAAKPYDEIISALNHTFVIVDEAGVRWVHPSARDLVIAELKRDRADRLRFIRTATPNGLALATSVAGDQGAQHFPLLESDADWDALRESMHALALSTPLDLALILSNEAFAQRVKNPSIAAAQERLQHIFLESLWPVIVGRLNTLDAWTGEMLVHYVRHIGGASPVALELHGFAAREIERVREVLENDQTVFWQRSFGIDETLDYLRAVHQLSGSVSDVTTALRTIVDEVMDVLDDELDASYSDSELTLEDHQEYQGQCESLIVSLRAVERMLGQELDASRRERLLNLSSRLQSEASSHEEPGDYRRDRSGGRPTRTTDDDDVSIEQLFSDL